jgi:hypothetical protein
MLKQYLKVGKTHSLSMELDEFDPRLLGGPGIALFPEYGSAYGNWLA